LSAIRPNHQVLLKYYKACLRNILLDALFPVADNLSHPVNYTSTAFSTSATEPRSFPKELVTKCYLLVEQTHRRFGFRQLPGMITTKKNMVILTLFEESRTITHSLSAAFKLRLTCWAACVTIAGIAWAYSWWILLVISVVVLLDRWLALSEKRYWMLQAAFLLSLEMLAANFAGWGSKYPREKATALEALECASTIPQTIWLDYYLPSRANIDAATLKQFGPS
jgi:hypothetical protein